MKGMRAGWRIVAGLLAVGLLAYGLLMFGAVGDKRHVFAACGFGMIFGVYAIFGRTGIRALDE